MYTIYYTIKPNIRFQKGDIMKYVMTPLEDLVQQLYQRIDVCQPDHSIDDIADRLDIELCYLQTASFSSRGCVVLDPRLSPEKQKEVFGHELAHVLFHVGIQLIMPESFRLLQEYQARNFALHFCVPTFMLLNQKLYKERAQSVDLIAKTYSVTHEFADLRLAHYERQIKAALFYERLNDSNLINKKDTNVFKQSKAIITV